MFLYILTFLLLLLKKVGKIYPCFVAFLIKKIIPLALVGYKMIVAKSARLSSHIQQALVEQLLIFPFKDGTGGGGRDNVGRDNVRSKYGSWEVETRSRNLRSMRANLLALMQ